MNFSNKSLVMTALLVFVALVGISAISAANVGSGDALDGNNTFVMSVPYSPGYHWEVSPDSYGVELIDHRCLSDFSYYFDALDHPDDCGSSGTSFFTFHVYGDDFFAKLVLVSPSGDIVDEVDTNMLN